MILGGLGGLEAYFWEDFLHNRLLLKFKSSSTSLAVLHWTPLDSTLAASKGTCLNPNGMRRSPRSGLNARGSCTPRVLDFLDIRLSQFLPWEGLRPLWRRVRGGRRLFAPAPF